MNSGRPPVRVDLAATVRRLRANGLSWREIGRALGVSHMTAKRFAAPVTKLAGGAFAEKRGDQCCD